MDEHYEQSRRAVISSAAAKCRGFLCSYCSKIEPDAWKLQRHMNRRHGRSPVSADLLQGKANSPSAASLEEDEDLDGEKEGLSSPSGVEGMEWADGLMRERGNTDSSNFSEDSSPRKLQPVLRVYT